MNTKAYLSELLGTFLLSLAVGASLSVGTPLSTPVVAALTLGVGVYLFGSIGGSHLNPAISIMLMIKQKLSVKDTVFYVIAQIIGAFLASAIVMKLYGGISGVHAVDSTSILLAEILGTFCLGLGVSSVVHGKVSDAASGLTIGGSLLLGILLAGKVSNGVLNPAVAFSIHSLSASYIVGPLVGATLAGLLYQYLDKK